MNVSIFQRRATSETYTHTHTHTHTYIHTYIRERTYTHVHRQVFPIPPHTYTNAKIITRVSEFHLFMITLSFPQCSHQSECVFPMYVHTSAACIPVTSIQSILITTARGHHHHHVPSSPTCISQRETLRAIGYFWHTHWCYVMTC